MNDRPAGATPAIFQAGAGDAHLLVSALAAAVYTCDAQGRVTLYNDAAAALWGRRPEVGTDLWCGSWKIFNPDGSPLPLDRCPMAVALTEGRSVRGVEIVVERPDGTRRAVLPHAEPIRDASGNLVGAVNLLLDITEQKKAEEAQALLAAVVTSSDDAIITKSLEGRITSWNGGAERIFGYTASEIVGRSITTLIPDDRLVEEQTILQRLRRGERIDHFETVRVTKDGRLIEISLTVSPLRDAGGRLIGASKVARDISAQKRAEEALRRSERNLADFFENATLGLHWMDARGTVVRANKTELAMLGYQMGEYVGRHIAEFHADQAAIEDMLARLRRGEDVVEYPARMRRKDGAIRHVRVSSSVLREGSEFVHTRCFTRDVTEQVLAQEALAESEARLRTLLSLLPVGVYSCDAEGRITFFNRRAAELWGCEPGAEPTRFDACFRAFLPDGSPMPPDRTPMAEAVSEGKSSRDVEAVLERPDGTKFHASVNTEPVRDDDGRVRGAICVIQDITVQVAAREALKHQQAVLEDAVDARTAELEASHRRLRLSERMAALGTLSAGLGHDLGNLLLPVRVSLEVLASATLPGDVQEEVERIRTSVEYLQQLANGLRMMALDPENSGPAEPLHVATWWADAHSIVKNALPRGVSLEADVADDAWVGISRPALTQVVFNLAQNAGEALRGRPDGRIRIVAKREDERVLLVVEDNGPGMSEEVRDRCMEPFFTTKPRGISTGLGLVLVGGLVREAGGTVQIQSELGRGTVFRLGLPLVEPRTEESAGAVPRGYAVVDIEDARLRSVVAFELRHLAFDILADARGPEIDLVVTDGRSPLSPEAREARRVVLFAEADGQPANVTAIGRRPRAEAIRGALSTAAREVRAREAATG